MRQSPRGAAARQREADQRTGGELVVHAGGHATGARIEVVAAGPVGIAVGVVGTAEGRGPDVPARGEWCGALGWWCHCRVGARNLGRQRTFPIGREPGNAISRSKTGATEAATIGVEWIEHQQQELVHPLE
jgi:hypothetical protein